MGVHPLSTPRSLLSETVANNDKIEEFRALAGVHTVPTPRSNPNFRLPLASATPLPLDMICLAPTAWALDNVDYFSYFFFVPTTSCISDGSILRRSSINLQDLLCLATNNEGQVAPQASGGTSGGTCNSAWRQKASQSVPPPHLQRTAIDPRQVFHIRGLRRTRRQPLPNKSSYKQPSIE